MQNHCITVTAVMRGAGFLRGSETMGARAPMGDSLENTY